MHKSMWLGLMAGVLLAVGGSGCQNTVNTVENADKTMTPRAIVDRRFVTDAFLRDRLKLTEVITADTPAGYLMVQVKAVNVRTGFFDQLWSGMTDTNPYKIDYRFSWRDQAGMEVRDIVTWKSMTVIPGETVFIQAIAPTRECRDFELSLKESEAANQ